MIQIRPSVCPHDCPSACALDVDVGPDQRIGRLRGAADHPFTQGVICEKVGRYAERVHNPDRILQPLLRSGPKGAGLFSPISWDQALDLMAKRLVHIGQTHGPAAIWPYAYAGTMGLVQRGASERLRRAMGWSGQGMTICATIAGAGWMAGVGAKWGVDLREMAQSDLILIWGGNPVATQVQVMGLIAQARKDRGAKLVVIDPYRSPTAEKADLHLAVRPGTDGALACAIMHVLFRDGLVDRDYMARLTEGADRLEAHIRDRSPQWAAPICGLTPLQIEDLANLYGHAKRSFLRIGYGMSRSRNGAVNLHAVSCLPALTGAWSHPGGGAALSLSGLANLDRTLIEATDLPDPPRQLDMCQLGSILRGDRAALKDGPPVAAMLVQNSNPALVAPDSGSVLQGLAQDDLFLVVHEQTMTATARFADLVLPATTFLEHDDLYTAYGQTTLQVAKAVIPPVGQARSNHWLVGELAKRLGASHASFGQSEWDLIDDCLTRSGLSGADELARQRWLDIHPGFEKSHFLGGFGHGGRFRFAPHWPDPSMPALPDHWDVIEKASPQYPFRLITPPSRHFLNSTFNETALSRQKASRPTLLMHAADAAGLGLADGDVVRIGNNLGAICLHMRIQPGIAQGVTAVEGIWNHPDFIQGVGINLLVKGDPVPPFGGAAFHDIAIWIEKQA